MPENIKISAENGGIRRLSALAAVKPPFFSVLRVDILNLEIDRYYQKCVCYGVPKFFTSKVAFNKSCIKNLIFKVLYF